MAPILPSPLTNKSHQPIEHLNLESDEDSIKSDDIHYDDKSGHIHIDDKNDHIHNDDRNDHIHNDDRNDDDSFSDDSELLPPVDVHKTSPAKKLFGLDSDEDVQENPPNENKLFGGDLIKSADQQKNGGKIEEKSPRSISVGDVDTNEEDDFW